MQSKIKVGSRVKYIGLLGDYYPGVWTVTGFFRTASDHGVEHCCTVTKSGHSMRTLLKHLRGVR